jgi:2-(1,2-epoxy-1,2-dihydrophenyl)acetyl-CoA isomerase
MTAYETLLVERSGAVATVSLNRPDQRNSINLPMMAELHAALREIASDAAIRIVVFRGKGADFCPGADVKHYGGDGFSQSVRPSWSSVDNYKITVLLHEMPQVTVAAVAGGCAGAGFGWACACDLRVASETARFNTAFLNVGVAGDMGLPWFLPRLLGAAKARELCLLPGKFDAHEAHRIGLVSRVSPAASFEADLAALVGQLENAAPVALRTLKGNFIAAERMGLADYITFEAERHERVFLTEDTKEAFRAYVEKRPPAFQGR